MDTTTERTPVRFAVQLDGPTYARLKRRAEENDETMARLVRRLIANELRRRPGRE